MNIQYVGLKHEQILDIIYHGQTSFDATYGGGGFRLDWDKVEIDSKSAPDGSNSDTLKKVASIIYPSSSVLYPYNEDGIPNNIGNYTVKISVYDQDSSFYFEKSFNIEVKEVKAVSVNIVIIDITDDPNNTTPISTNHLIQGHTYSYILNYNPSNVTYKDATWKYKDENDWKNFGGGDDYIEFIGTNFSINIAAHVGRNLSIKAQLTSNEAQDSETYIIDFNRDLFKDGALNIDKSGNLTLSNIISTDIEKKLIINKYNLHLTAVDKNGLVLNITKTLSIH